MAFVTTHWSVVLTAQSRSPAADNALETLCRAYWKPLFAFVRREGYQFEEAEDLTQEFFARLLERRDFDAVRQGEREVAFLFARLDETLSREERERSKAIKRGRGERPISLDEIQAHRRFAPEPVESLTADQIYERQWAMAVLDRFWRAWRRIIALVGEGCSSIG